jgi:hypothetical protein
VQEVFNIKYSNLLLLFGDIIAILLFFIYLYVFHLLSLGSFLFEGYPDEKIVMKPSEWLAPIIIVGTLTYFYIKYLWGSFTYKKFKIYLLVFGFLISILLNTIWTILSIDLGDSNYLFVQLTVLGITLMLLFTTNHKRKKLLY